MSPDDLSIQHSPPAIGPMGPQGGRPPITVGPQAGPSFAEILERRGQEVKLSTHAQARLKSRNITWDQNMQEKLNSLVDKAAAKGARESLILLENLALIVSVRNRTVITAVDGQNIKDSVFTNIDSAVIG